MMSPVLSEQIKAKIKQLIDNYHANSQPGAQSEANVRANFVDPLFELLGWPIHNTSLYNREEYVRGVGFADIALKIKPDDKVPLIFVEAKRFGAIESLDRVKRKRDHFVAQLQLKVQGMSVDRTKEEQQAINYAYQNGMRWAVLTNFEHFRLFDARQDTLVLSFDSPEELLERFDELWQLAFSEVQQGSLEALRGHRQQLDIDEEYLRLINEWRLHLGQDIVSYPENRVLLASDEVDRIDVYKLRDVVQRILDRLVVIRYAEDRLVIKADQLRILVETRERSDYSFPLLDQIRNFFRKFNVRHNGTLFAEHLCDKMIISEDVLNAIILNLYDARFRAMSADIMGNTYEQYLGKTLYFENGNVIAVDNTETRKAQGSYYTPEYIVRYIVDRTLGSYLYATENGCSDGVPISGQSRKKLEDIDGSNGKHPLTILDPACGSGSFLMYAYHVLEEFYTSEIVRITAERDFFYEELVAKKLSPFEIQVELVGYKQRLEDLKNYKNQILERHLYGVDLDPQAAELASVNLMLRAMTRDIRLPLILNQNIKIGNALLSGVAICGEQAQAVLSPFAQQLAELRKLRLTQQGVIKESQYPIELQAKFQKIADEITRALDQKLSTYFGGKISIKRPFDWCVEFPEVFLDETGQLRNDGGFTFIIGNPPYMSVDDTWGQNSPDAAYLRTEFAEIWAGKSDIYYYFLRRALSLLEPHGQLGFITARYYLEAYYASKLRQVILQEALVGKIVDFGDYTVFNRVGTKTCITLLQREEDLQFRAENHLLSNRVPNKSTDILAFLNEFMKTAYPIKQAGLDSNSWNLYGQVVDRMIQKIDNGATPLGEITFIGKGMETGRNEVFVVDKATLERYHIEPELIRKIVKNQDITPYNVGFRGLYLIYPEAVETLDDFRYLKIYLEENRELLENRAAFKRGDCEWWQFTWPLHKEKYSLPKLITPFIASKNRFAFDAINEYIGLTDTYAIFQTNNSPDLRYLLALLNSKLLTFRFRYIGKPKDYRYEYVENGLKKIPIRFANETITEEIVNLAQKMLDLSFIKQTITDEFVEILFSTMHTKRSFYHAYYNHSEYKGRFISRAGSADANASGTVVGIIVTEQENHINITISEETSGEFPLITLDIPDHDLRRFLFLAFRAELYANNRKQIWVRGHLLSGSLTALQVPVLDDTSAKANIIKIYEFIEEIRQRIMIRVNKTLGNRSIQYSELLDIRYIEREIANVDQQINDIVYQIYDITTQEEKNLIDS